MHEWMVDNGLTPHIVIDLAKSGVSVPDPPPADGKIVLNVSPAATRALSLGNDRIEFETRFAGVPRQMTIPVGSVLGIYARENGLGMLFADDGGGPPSPVPPEGSTPDAKRPTLKIVK